jgi:hypothetical protein
MKIHRVRVIVLLTGGVLGLLIPDRLVPLVY